MRKFFAALLTMIFLIAGALPALAAGGPPASGNSDDEYIVGLLGPIEVLRPFDVGFTSMEIFPFPSWGGYYFPGMTISRGTMEVTNKAPVAFGLALWADPSPSSWRGIDVLVRNVRAARRIDSEGKYSPWVKINPPDNLILGSGETWTIEYEVVVAPDSWGGRIERMLIRINHLSMCPGLDGLLEICGVG